MEDDIVAIPQIIQNPDEIRLSDKLFEGKPVIEFVKTINGKTTVAAYVSAKHLDLTVQTMYSGKNKGNLATAAGDQAPANTPEAHAGTVPKSSIRNETEIVNPDSSAAQQGYAPEGGVQRQARPSTKNPEVLDPRTVTRADVVEMLNNVKAGKYSGNSYIPVRISTPGIVQERLFASNLPVIMPVSKVAQAFSPDNGPMKGKNIRGHGFSETQLIEIVERMDSPDYVYAQDDGRGVEVIKIGNGSDNTVVLVEFNNNVNPAYMNGYEGGAYNVSITVFNVDGGNIGLFMYGQEKGWHEVFNKQKEGDPAKKFPATRPFAVEQDSLNDNVPHSPSAVNTDSVETQHQKRTGTVTNWDVLEQASGMVQNLKLTDGQKYALEVFNQRLAKVKELSAQKERQMQILKELRKSGTDADEQTKTKNRINNLNRMIRNGTAELLDIENKAVLRQVLTKARTVIEAEQTTLRRKAVEDYRNRRNESQEKTAMRHKIQHVVGELNQLLLNGDKKRHVPESLKKAVAEALALVNMDTVGAEERAAKYAALITEEQAKTQPDQNKIDAYTATMENILRQGEKLGKRLQELRDAYEEIQESVDPDIANAYDPVIAGCLKELSQSIGNTPLKDMTMEQLSDVYDMYRMVLTRVRDANKSHTDSIGASIADRASRVVGEIKRAGGEHTHRMAVLDLVGKFDWNNLKPVYAFERMGSATMAEAYNQVRAGEDVWAKDVAEAREFYLEKAKQYGYDEWEFDSKHRFTSASGLEFELSLEGNIAINFYTLLTATHTCSSSWPMAK